MENKTERELTGLVGDSDGTLYHPYKITLNIEDLKKCIEKDGIEKFIKEVMGHLENGIRQVHLETKK